MTDTSSDTALIGGITLAPSGFPRSIAITGEKGHGKDTVAKAIVALTGAKIIRFADGLKDMLRAFYTTCMLAPDEIERRIEGDLKEENCIWLGGKTPRYAMQTLGTEWRQLVWPKMWVHQQQARVEMHGDCTVTPDLRFLLEEEAVDKVGGLKIRVVDPRKARNESSAHVSEQEMAMIKVHHTLINDGSISELHAKVDAILAGYSAVRSAA